MNRPEPLEVGDIERPATVDVALDTLALDDSKVSAIEVIREDEPPWVKLELSGPWGEVSALLSIEDARAYRDRLTEVIEVAADAEDPNGYVYICDHCLKGIPSESVDERDGRHYHPDCPHEPMSAEAASAIVEGGVDK